MTAVDKTTTAERVDRSADGLATIKVWDIAIRLFHWSLVASFVIAWITADEWDRLHEIFGYAIGILLAFRLIWGFIGSRHARFGDFVYGPMHVLRYLRDSVYGEAKRYIGHNPAGGTMVIVLLFSLMTITITGIAMTSRAFWGVEWVEDLHEFSAYLTLLLIAFHIAGVIYASFEHHENLVRSMITGFKRRDED